MVLDPGERVSETSDRIEPVLYALVKGEGNRADARCKMRSPMSPVAWVSGTYQVRVVHV